MPTTLTDTAIEESTFVLTLSFTDEDDAAVTPKTGTWTLTDEAGNVINSRLDVEISALASSVDIVLSGDDLAIGTYGGQRVLLFEGTYDSDAGTDLPLKDQVRFTIDNLVGVS